MTPTGLHVSDDLLFTSKVTATARAHGLEMVTARSAGLAVEAARRVAPAAVLLDLQNPGLDLPEILAGLRAACPVMPRVIGYGSHLARETLDAARAAGLDRVMPRSKFVASLETDLAGWIAGGREA
ncbi:MAG: hypothetical protein U0871_27360 [Gemmataceae bacterium]